MASFKSIQFQKLTCITHKDGSVGGTWILIKVKSFAWLKVHDAIWHPSAVPGACNAALRTCVLLDCDVFLGIETVGAECTCRRNLYLTVCDRGENSCRVGSDVMDVSLCSSLGTSALSTLHIMYWNPDFSSSVKQQNLSGNPVEYSMKYDVFVDL